MDNTYEIYLAAQKAYIAADKLHKEKRSEYYATSVKYEKAKVFRAVYTKSYDRLRNDYTKALVEYEKSIEVYMKEIDEYKKAHIAFVTGKKDS